MTHKLKPEFDKENDPKYDPKYEIDIDAPEEIILPGYIKLADGRIVKEVEEIDVKLYMLPRL